MKCCDVGCRLHATCVLQHTNLLMYARGGLHELQIVESMLASAMYLAAICHDYDHPGETDPALVTRSTASQ